MRSAPAYRAFLGMGAHKLMLDLFPGPTRRGRAGKIRQVGLRITDRCNLRCLTCGQWGPEGFLRRSSSAELAQRELPPATYQRLFADLRAGGHRPFVYIWGGEPLLYSGLPEVLRTASACELPVTIATNGTLLEPLAGLMTGDPMHILQVSIDAPDAQLHKTARPGAGGGDGFVRLCAGLDAVRRSRRDRGGRLPLIVSLTTISRTNQHRLVDIYRRFQERVDLMVFYLSWWIDLERADDHEDDFHRRFGFRPSLHRGWLGDWRPEAYQDLDRQLGELRRLSCAPQAPPVVILPHILGTENLRAYYTDHQRLFGHGRCQAIFHNLEVGSNGDVSPCRDYHDFVVGNIAGQPLAEVWNSPAHVRFRRSIAAGGLMPVCARCCGLMGY